MDVTNMIKKQHVCQNLQIILLENKFLRICQVDVINIILYLLFKQNLCHWPVFLINVLV